MLNLPAVSLHPPFPSPPLLSSVPQFLALPSSPLLRSSPSSPHVADGVKVRSCIGQGSPHVLTAAVGEAERR
eukprot:467958-Hanusia_phi.AAC.1